MLYLFPFELVAAARSSFSSLITVNRLAISLSAIDNFVFISVIVFLHSRSSTLSDSCDSFSEIFSWEIFCIGIF